MEEVSNTYNHEKNSKLNNIDYYILNDKNKFFNWVYPRYEDTSYKYIENEKLNNFNETQGQLFAKQFLVDSPYRGILLYHGLGTGKTCAALITSEKLITKKHVLLFIPASLKQNWINELSFCGNPTYKTKEHIFKNYTFINYNSGGVKSVYNNIKNNIYLDSSVEFKKNGESYNGKVTEIVDGIFKHNNYKPNNIKVTIDKTNEVVECNIVENNVKLLDNTNPFDNKIIIFDEVHNYIVTLSNLKRTVKKPSPIQKVKLDIYDDLKNAINCKIILLSGTPIVNNSYEIAFISNILNGNNVVYKYDYLINSNNINKYIDVLKNSLNETLKFINYINIEIDNNKLYLYFILNPDYFVNTNNYEIVSNSENINISEKLELIRNTIENILSSNSVKFSYIRTKKSYLDSKYIPDNIETFNETFLETAYDKKFNIQYYKSIKNIDTLKSLLAGKISYLRGDLPIKTIVNKIEIPMGEAQQNEYSIVRNKELEQSRRRSQNTDDLNLANLRPQSRKVCNIYLPQSEEYIEEDTDSENEDDDDENSKKKNIKEMSVLNFINKFSEDLPENPTEQKNKILEKINHYSCKFAYLINVLIKSTHRSYNDTNTQSHYPTGKVLIYSNFREIVSGGVSFIGKLLEIKGLEFYNLQNIFLDIVNDFFETVEEKEQQKNSYFEDELKNKLIQKYIEILEINPEYKNKVFYMWKASDSKSTKMNYIAHLIYDSLENIDGKLLRIMFITKSGSEGISFKTIRQVHIIEPYWQQTRETQVIGRAVRRGSHDTLQESKRNVFVYKYLCKFRTSDYSSYDLKQDNNMTTDQYITSVSIRKQSIIKTFYSLIQSVALDCPYNNEQISCFSYNNIDYYENVNNDPIYFNDGISTYNLDIVSKEAQLVIYNNQKFIVYNKNLYDYEKYSLHNVLIKIGILEEKDSNVVFKITRDYSANKTCFIETNISTTMNIDTFNNTTIKMNKLDTNTDNYTLVQFDTVITGGSNSDFEYYTDSDESSSEEEDEEDLYDPDYMDEISVVEEEKMYNSINLFVNDEFVKYNLEDYICLVDNISNEKILIGLVKKITDKYIVVNKEKIPIILKDTNNIILYKIIDRREFINNLGLKILNLYTQSDNIYLIYDDYNKNSVVDLLINNIYNRLQKYPKNYNFEVTESSSFEEETLDDKIIEQLLQLTDKSINKDALSDLSMSESYPDLEDNTMSNRKINKEKASIIIDEYYIPIIVQYFNTYINTLNDEPGPFDNSKKTTIIKKIKKLIKEDLDGNIVYIRTLLKLLFYIESSLDKKNDDITDIEEFVHYENSKIIDLYKKIQLSSSLRKLVKSFVFYKSHINTIEMNIDENVNTTEFLSESSEKEESSEDVDEECFKININVDKYFNTHHTDVNIKHSDILLIKSLMCFNKILSNKLYGITDFEEFIINNSDVDQIIEDNISRFIEAIKASSGKKKKGKKKNKTESTTDTKSETKNETTLEPELDVLKEDLDELKKLQDDLDNKQEEIEKEISENIQPDIVEAPDEQEPVDDEQQPVDDIPAPVDDEQQPVDDIPEPVDDIPEPVDDEQEPVDDIQKDGDDIEASDDIQEADDDEQAPIDMEELDEQIEDDILEDDMEEKK